MANRIPNPPNNHIPLVTCCRFASFCSSFPATAAGVAVEAIAVVLRVVVPPFPEVDVDRRFDDAPTMLPLLTGREDLMCSELDTADVALLPHDIDVDTAIGVPDVRTVVFDMVEAVLVIRKPWLS